jgi:hypothetical protein
MGRLKNYGGGIMRDEERKAAELVEKKCENCIYGENKGCLRCSGYLGMAMFIPTQSAIDAKVEELRKEQIIEGSKERINRVEAILSSPWTALETIEKFEQDNAEMLGVLRASYIVLVNTCKLCYKRTCKGCATQKLKDKIEVILKKVEGK